jgi:hypothetical protein
VKAALALHQLSLPLQRLASKKRDRALAYPLAISSGCSASYSHCVKKLEESLITRVRHPDHLSGVAFGMKYRNLFRVAPQELR